jgi:hypothetical protein
MEKGGLIMIHIVDSAKITLNDQFKFSSFVSKNGILVFDGRSASIFRINTDLYKSMI